MFRKNQFNFGILEQSCSKIELIVLGSGKLAVSGGVWY